MKRVAIFTSACCTGWAFAYEADDQVQAMIHKHAAHYNSDDEWNRRNMDGTVRIYDTEDEAANKETGDTSIDVMLSVFADDGDGRRVDAAWVVHMLLSDPMDYESWLPPQHVTENVNTEFEGMGEVEVKEYWPDYLE